MEADLILSFSMIMSYGKVQDINFKVMVPAKCLPLKVLIVKIRSIEGKIMYITFMEQLQNTIFSNYAFTNQLEGFKILDFLKN